MANNCLVTQLKGTVNADLLKFGEVALCNVKKGQIGYVMFYGTQNSEYYVRAINGTLCDSSGQPLGVSQVDIPNATEVSVYVKASDDKDATIVFKNGYNPVLVHLGNFYYMPQGAKELSTNLIGDLSDAFKYAPWFNGNVDFVYANNLHIDVSKIKFADNIMNIVINGGNSRAEGKMPVIESPLFNQINISVSEIELNILDLPLERMIDINCFSARSYGNLTAIAQRLNLSYNSNKNLYIGRGKEGKVLTGTVEEFFETLLSRGWNKNMIYGIQSPEVTIAAGTEHETTTSAINNDLYVEFATNSIIVHGDNTAAAPVIASYNGSTWTYNL